MPWPMAFRYMSPDMRFPAMCMCDQQRLRPACTYTQSDQSLEYSMTLRLLTEHNLEFLSLKGGTTGLSGSTLVKMPMGIPLKNRNKFISPYQYIIRANKYIHDMNNKHTHRYM